MRAFVVEFAGADDRGVAWIEGRAARAIGRAGAARAARARSSGTARSRCPTRRPASRTDPPAGPRPSRPCRRGRARRGSPRAGPGSGRSRPRRGARRSGSRRSGAASRRSSARRSRSGRRAGRRHRRGQDAGDLGLARRERGRPVRDGDDRRDPEVADRDEDLAERPDDPDTGRSGSRPTPRRLAQRGRRGSASPVLGLAAGQADLAAVVAVVGPALRQHDGGRGRPSGDEQGETAAGRASVDGGAAAGGARPMKTGISSDGPAGRRRSPPAARAAATLPREARPSPSA